MRILQLSDFHFKKNHNTYKQENIVNAIKKTISNIEPIDIFLFNGDLVFDGQNFDSAHEVFINQIMEATKLSIDKVIICQGNHDINQQENLQSLSNFSFSDLKLSEQINDFVIKKSNDYVNSLKPSSNYIEYIENNFKHLNVVEEGLLYTYVLEIEGNKIGFTIINSAWFSSKYHDDSKNLIFPVDILEDSLKNLQSCHLKVFVTHHPLNYFKEDNYRKLEDFVLTNFNLCFSGHEHKERIGTNYKAGNGIFLNCSQATLCVNEQGSEIGFAISDYDFNDNSTIKVERYSYNSNDNNFNKIETLSMTLPVGIEKENNIRLRKKITSKYDKELNIANKLIVDYQEELLNGFNENFTTPKLSRSSETKKDSYSIEDNNLFDELNKLENNFIIYGKDKSGKTSLLKKLQLDFLFNYREGGVIPFYVDYKENEETEDSILNLARSYFELNIADTKKLMDSNNFVLLVDNLNPSSIFHNSVLNCFVAFPKMKFVFTSDETLSLQYLENLPSTPHEKIYLKELSRNEIRLFTKKNKNVKSDDIETVLEKLTSLCKQMQLPVNYWTISLLLFVYKKSNDDYEKNLFSVLDVLVDELLHKKKSLFNKSKLTFAQYKVLCSELAYYLYKEHSDYIYSAEYHDIINFLVDYKKSKLRMPGDPKDIFDNLIASGLLTQKGVRYTYRLNGIFEYFLAFYLSDKESLRNEIINDDEIYLSFKNELELYSGFKRNDSDFVSKIYKKTRFIFKTLIDKYSTDKNLDDSLIKNIEINNIFIEKVNKMKAFPIKPQIIDNVNDIIEPINTDAEVHLKVKQKENKLDFSGYEDRIKILARVLKNSDDLKSEHQINEVYDFIIEAYCSLGFSLMVELEKNISSHFSEKIEENEVFEILEVANRVVPLIVQNMIYDGMGHKNFETIILNKINLLKVDSANNQYKLFILYLLLIDSDFTHKEKIEELFSLIKIPALKYSIIIKLKMYLSFKSNEDKKLQNFLSNKIQKAQKLFDPETNLNQFQKVIASSKKESLVKKQIED